MSSVTPKGNQPIAAGRLRRKLIIRQRTPTSDGLLGQTSSYTTVLTTWGSVTARNSSALLQLLAGQQMAQTVYDIVMRYPPSLGRTLSIEPGMQVVDGTRVYSISNVNDVDERHRMLHLACVQAPAT